MCQASLFSLRRYYLLTGIPRLHRTTRGAAVHAGRLYEEAPEVEAAPWANAEDLVRRAKTWDLVG